MVAKEKKRVGSKKSCWQELQQGQNECQKGTETEEGGPRLLRKKSVCIFDFLHRNKAECEHKLRE